MQANHPQSNLISQDGPGQQVIDPRPVGAHGVLALVAPSPQRLVLAAVFLSYLAFGVLFQLFPPLLSALGKEFHVNHGAASLVMTLFLLPILVVAFPAGALVARYGVRRIGVWSFALLMAGALVSLVAPAFAVLLPGRAAWPWASWSPGCQQGRASPSMCWHPWARNWGGALRWALPSCCCSACCSSFCGQCHEHRTSELTLRVSCPCYAMGSCGACRW